MTTPSYLICAGEPSGDLLAADVVKAFTELQPSWQAFGVTGRHMKEAGVKSIAGIEDLSVMGFTDVIKQLPKLKRFENRLLSHVDEIQPAFIILVDYPGLHLRLAERFRLRGFLVFQLVAPQLWAWKEKRVKDWKREVDHMLTVLPFEVDFFGQRGMNVTYVGTPQYDRVLKMRKQNFDLNLKDSKSFGFFPGSRAGEFKKMFPLYLDTIKNLKDTEFQFYVSLAPDIPLDFIQNIIAECGLGTLQHIHEKDDYSVFETDGIVFVRGRSLELMNHVDAACVTSGTATLECALCETPLCVAYITSKLNFAIAKRFVKLPNIALVNIVAGERIVEEFVQDIDPKTLAQELRDLAIGSRKEVVKSKLAQLHARLKGDMGLNSAQEILKFLNK